MSAECKENFCGYCGALVDEDDGGWFFLTWSEPDLCRDFADKGAVHE